MDSVPEIEYKKPETPTPEKEPKLQESKATSSCTEETSETAPNPQTKHEDPYEYKHEDSSEEESNPIPEKPVDRENEESIVEEKSLPEKEEKTVNRKRKYQKRKTSVAKRRKPTKTVNRGGKKSKTKKQTATQDEEKQNSSTAALFSNTDSSDDEVTIPDSLFEEKSSPNENEPQNIDHSKKGKVIRKRNSPESESQKSIEKNFVRRSSRQSVPPTEVYQSFRLSPRRKPALKKEVPVITDKLTEEIKPEEQKDPLDENPPIKTSEEESTFDTNCPPPPFVCVTDTDSESSDPVSPDPPRVTPRIKKEAKVLVTKVDTPKETVRRSGRAKKRPPKYSEGLTKSPEENQAVSTTPETERPDEIPVATGSTDWKERYDELKKKFDEQAKELENEKLKNLKLEVEHLRERNKLQVNEILISEAGFPILELELVVVARSMTGTTVEYHNGTLITKSIN